MCCDRWLGMSACFEDPGWLRAALVCVACCSVTAWGLTLCWLWPLIVKPMTFWKLCACTVSTVVWIHNALCHFNPLGYGKRMIKPGQFWCVNWGTAATTTAWAPPQLIKCTAWVLREKRKREHVVFCFTLQSLQKAWNFGFCICFMIVSCLFHACFMLSVRQN